MSLPPTPQQALDLFASPQTISVFKFYEELGLQPSLIGDGDTIYMQVPVHEFDIDLVTQIDPKTNLLVCALIVPLDVKETHMDAVLELMMRANLEVNFGCYEYDYDRKQLIFRLTNIFVNTEFEKDILSSILNTSFTSLDEFCVCLVRVMQTPDHLIGGLSIRFLLEKSDFLIGDDEEFEENKGEGKA